MTHDPIQSTLNVTHNFEDFTIEDAIIAHRDIQDGFIFPLLELSFKSKKYEAFLTDLGNFCELETFDYSKTKNNISRRITSENIRMYVHGNSLDMYGGIYCKTEEICRDIWNIYLRHVDKRDSVDLYMHSYFMNNGNLGNDSKTVDHTDFDYISDLYYPYINTDVMFDQFFTGAENILLIVGEPGLGKSKCATLALKHAINNSENLPYDKIVENPALDSQYITTVYVKSTDVLINDKFWRALASHKADFCIIDDLDYMLTKRDSEVHSQDDQKKNDFLNQFLSFTDGVEKHNTKFIITTNQTYNDIDSALLRKGRLFDILELRALTQGEAFDIWASNDLESADFYNTFATDSVLPADLGSEISKRKNVRITTSCESYLKETGISKVVKANRVKKISL
jgi:DNA replication protein DnaC